MKPLAAFLAFATAAIVAALGLGAIFSGLSPLLAWISLVIGLLVAIFAWRGTNDPNRPPIRTWDVIMLGVFAIASLRAFLWVAYYDADELKVLSPNNLGDLSLHLNFIRYLASGVPFWPDSPILTGVPLTYPPGADLLNSLLELCGVDTIRGLVWIGLIGAAFTGWALWRWGGAFALAALLFNGGLAGFFFFNNFQLEDFQTKLVWKNFFLSMLVTQRGLLVALPVGFFLLTVWRERWFRSGKLLTPWWLQLGLYAMLPLFNLHAFLFLSAALVAFFIAVPSARSSLATLVGASFIPATVCVLLITANFSTKSGLAWNPTWIMGEDGWKVWFWDFGITIPLMIALAAIVFINGSREARTMVGVSLFIFVFACFVVLTIWPWDNMKLMIWSWLVIAPYLWSDLIARLHVWSRAAVCFLLFFSGAASLAGGLDGRHGYGIARRSELDRWSAAIKDIPPTALFACAPDYNHPLILLGRKVACGYDGHLWSHGLDYLAKMDALQRLLKREPNWPADAKALNVDFLAIRFKENGTGEITDLRHFLRQYSGNPAAQPPQPQSVD